MRSVALSEGWEPQGSHKISQKPKSPTSRRSARNGAPSCLDIREKWATRREMGHPMLFGS